MVGAKLAWKQTCQIYLRRDENMECTLVPNQLILNLKVLTQHCSSLVAYMFEISIKITCIFSRLDSLLRAFN